MSFLSTNLIRASSHLTRLIGMRWGDILPLYFVTEYPKSGGTWLAQMLADYLVMPAPQHYHLPVAFRSVVQNHYAWTPRLRNVCYLHRDGRDCCVSAMFHMLRAYEHADRSQRRYYRRRVPFVEDLRVNPHASDLFAGFVESWCTRPLFCRARWADHVLAWHRGCNPNKHFVSYEALRLNCGGELARLVTGLTGEPVDSTAIEATVDKFSFRRRSGRAPGHEDPGSHLRKGVVGDWTNHFGAEARQIFDRHCGDALIALGYEPDRAWVRQVTAGAARLQ